MRLSPSLARLVYLPAATPNQVGLSLAATGGGAPQPGRRLPSPPPASATPPLALRPDSRPVWRQAREELRLWRGEGDDI